MSVQISVPDQVKVVAEKFAKEKDCSIGEAVESLVATAVGRLNAVRKYAKAVREGTKPPRAKRRGKGLPRASPQPKSKRVAKKEDEEATA